MEKVVDILEYIVEYAMGYRRVAEYEGEYDVKVVVEDYSFDEGTLTVTLIYEGKRYLLTLKALNLQPLQVQEEIKNKLER